MHRFLATVFDDITLATSSAPAYSDERWVQRLGTFDQLAVAVVVDHPDVAGGTINVYLEHSADGRLWDTKSALPLVTGAIVSGGQTQLAGGDSSGLPNLAFVRLRFHFDLTSPASALLKKTPTSRTNTRASSSSCSKRSTTSSSRTVL